MSIPNFVLGASKSALEKNYCPLHLHYGRVNCCRDICKSFVVIHVDLVLGYSGVLYKCAILSMLKFVMSVNNLKLVMTMEDFLDILSRILTKSDWESLKI